MKMHHVTFSGSMLERGFWLYIWRVAANGQNFYYVGRTGDSSSKYAASPFARLGQHLDTRKSATANMLMRQLRNVGVEPAVCKYDMVAVGPLFMEQESLEEHRKYRDIIAPLEVALAKHLEKRGFKVLGSHPRLKPYDETLFREIVTKFEQVFMSD